MCKLNSSLWLVDDLGQGRDTELDVPSTLKYTVLDGLDGFDGPLTLL
jgi:hypothetical protein